MKLLRRYIREILAEEIQLGAFHGFGMTPQQMRVDACNTVWTDPNQETGCPLFPGQGSVTKEEMSDAMRYLDEERPEALVAYSRGGAILLQALSNGATRPSTIYLVAPAWKRKWVGPLDPSAFSGGGSIVHGGMDASVPVRHSVEAALASGMPLHIVPDANHINILKHKTSTPGRPISNEALSEAMESLPDWGASGQATKEQLDAQHNWCLKFQ